LANLGLIDGWGPELIVSGINHGSNLGDDITYSGTVAAALEGIVLGIPGIAVSQQSNALELDFRQSEDFDFEIAAAFTAQLVTEVDSVPLPEGTLININAPGCPPAGVNVARLGKRIYRDELALVDQNDSARQYHIYGEPTHDSEERDTDIAAVADGRIAVTPLHFDLTYHAGVGPLQAHDLEQLLARASTP
jgi:5'-nucleotidase